MFGVLGVGACGAGKARFTVGFARAVEPSCRTSRQPFKRTPPTRWVVHGRSLLLHKLQIERLARHGGFLRRARDRGEWRLGEGCPRVLSRRVFSGLKQKCVV